MAKNKEDTVGPAAGEQFRLLCSQWKTFILFCRLYQKVTRLGDSVEQWFLIAGKALSTRIHFLGSWALSIVKLTGSSLVKEWPSARSFIPQKMQSWFKRNWYLNFADLCFLLPYTFIFSLEPHVFFSNEEKIHRRSACAKWTGVYSKTRWTRWLGMQIQHITMRTLDGHV